ncbi:MAG: hypothetical protein OEV21_05940 [Thermoplasmata archaeon]|nr:hypothetical protein [Thermoplasmata archaeon]
MTNSANIVAAKLEVILKSRCNKVGLEESEKIIDMVMKFFENLEGLRLKRSKLLQQAAETMRKTFGFEEVSVLMKGVDGFFRYEIIIGYNEKPEKELRSLVYTEEQIREPDSMPIVRINKYLDLTIAEAEQKPDQKVGYAHPGLMTMARKNFEDFAYGDYLDLYVFGKDEKPLTVFELSAPRDGKLPSANKLKWLCLFALLLGNVIEYQTE